MSFKKIKIKIKIFCFEKTKKNRFHTWQMHCEGVDEDSRHGAWHVDVHVETCIFLLNVCGCVHMALHV